MELIKVNTSHGEFHWLRNRVRHPVLSCIVGRQCSRLNLNIAI